MGPGSNVDQVDKTHKHQMTGLMYVDNTLFQNKPKSNQRKRGILLIDKPIARRIKITKGRSSQDFGSKDLGQNSSHFGNTYIDMNDQSMSKSNTQLTEIEEGLIRPELANIFVNTVSDGCEFDVNHDDTGDEDTKTFQQSTYRDISKDQTVV